jgi:hypothetical protein
MGQPTLIYQALKYWDFVEYVTRTEVDDSCYYAVQGLSSLQVRKEDWDLGVSWEEAVEMGTSGWAKASNSLHKIRASNESVMDLGAPSYEWDVVGIMPDIPEFLSGEPDCMINWSDDAATPIVRIGLEGSYSAGNSGSYAVNLGGALLSLIDALECAGYMVELTVAFRGIGGWGDEGIAVNTDIIVKTTDEYTDVSRVGYAVAHPAFFRKLYFRYLELLDTTHQEMLGGGYGRPGVGDPEDFDISIPAPDQYTSRTAEMALETVMQAAGKLIDEAQ